MDPTKLYHKSELFRKPYSKLKKYVAAQGLPIERGATRAKLAKQLIAAGIYRKSQSEIEKDKIAAFHAHKWMLIPAPKSTSSLPPKAQSPTYQRKSKQSFEVEVNSCILEGKDKPLRGRQSREIPGTPPPSLGGITTRTSSTQSRGGCEFPGTPEETTSICSFTKSMTPDKGYFSDASISYSLKGSDISIGLEKRTPESRSDFSFTITDPESLPASQTNLNLKRDPSNSSRSGSESAIQTKKSQVDIKHSCGEFPTDVLSPVANDKQRDSITIGSNHIPHNLKKAPKGRNTRKGRRTKKKKKKKRLADIKSETGERSSQDLLGSDLDGWPDIPPRPTGERDTIHVDPRTPTRALAKQTLHLPESNGFRELKAQLSEDLKGHDVNLESMKMYLLPLLNSKMKRILSDEESVLLQDMASQSEKHSDIEDNMASILLDDLSLPVAAHFDDDFPWLQSSETPDNRESQDEYRSYSSSESLLDDFSGISTDSFDRVPQKKCLVGKKRQSSKPNSDLGSDHAFLSPSMANNYGMRSASVLCFDDIIAEADAELEQEEADGFDSAEEVEQAPLLSEDRIPRRQKCTLRALRKRELEIQNHKQDLIDNVAYTWQAKSSVDGFYFDDGDRVIYEDRTARVSNRRKANGKAFYSIIMDDNEEEVSAPESELVYAMILQIRRRTISSKLSHSTQSSNSSMYYQTGTDKTRLSPRGGSTFHSFSEKRPVI